MTWRMSSGSRRAESAVEATRSQNMTVSWRRSAVSRAASAGEGLRDRGARATSSGAADGVFSPSIADMILSRWPTEATPRSFRSSTVSLGSTASSMSLSRNAASYCPRPRLRSQSPTSIVVSLDRGLCWSCAIAVSIMPGRTDRFWVELTRSPRRRSSAAI